MTGETTSRVCSLALAVGEPEACPEEACPFWEPGGAVLDGRCAVERFDLAGQSPVARLLLEIRERLASASSAEEAHAEMCHLRRLLNESSD
jgi:hypothetical protein